MIFLSKIFRKAKNTERHQRCNCTENSIEDVNFSLGFNDAHFSDRVLRLEIEPDLEVETLNVSSLILAAKSPFFYKLFKKNGVNESWKKAEFTLRIDASEKAAFMDMLNSVYDRPLKASSKDELVGVMMVAAKFEVTTCARNCVQLLIKTQFTKESALFYLKFISTLCVDNEITQPLIDAAKQHISSHFSGFNKLQQKEAMSLPLCAIEAVIGGDDFKVTSEEALLDFLLKWAHKHYPNLEERRDILTNRLLQFICFPCMTTSKLQEVVECPDFDTAQVAKLAFNILLHKTNGTPLSKCAFPRRKYNHHQVVFFDIKKQDCIDMIALSSRIYSDTFHLGRHFFSLFAYRYKKEGSSNEQLVVYVQMEGLETCTLNYDFSLMKKPSFEFIRMNTSTTHTFTETSGCWGFGKIPWTELMGDNDNYFIDGVIHIRAQLTLIN